MSKTKRRGVSHSAGCRSLSARALRDAGKQVPAGKQVREDAKSAKSTGR